MDDQKFYFEKIPVSLCAAVELEAEDDNTVALLTPVKVHMCCQPHQFFFRQHGLGAPGGRASAH